MLYGSLLGSSLPARCVSKPSADCRPAGRAPTEVVSFTPLRVPQLLFWHAFPQTSSVSLVARTPGARSRRATRLLADARLAEVRPRPPRGARACLAAQTRRPPRGARALCRLSRRLPTTTCSNWLCSTLLLFRCSHVTGSDVARRKSRTSLRAQKTREPHWRSRGPLTNAAGWLESAVPEIGSSLYSTCEIVTCLPFGTSLRPLARTIPNSVVHYTQTPERLSNALGRPWRERPP
jgi:hypothetical protein